MDAIVETIRENFEELICCELLSIDDPQIKDKLITSFASQRDIVHWLEWIYDGNRDFDILRIVLVSKQQLYVKKLSAETFLFLINEKESVPQILDFLNKLKYVEDTSDHSKNESVEEKVIDPKILDALRIQKMIYPKKQDMKALFKDCFVVHQQQDVVGGDFYWLKKTKSGALLAIIDCTGHSLEGAMTSMVCNTILNAASENYNDQGVNQLIVDFYKEITSYNETSKDVFNYGIGAEIGLFDFSFASDTLTFVSTGISFFMKTGDELVLNKTKKVMNYENIKEKIRSSSYKLSDIHNIYCFTDGVTDQFDKDDAKKLNYKGLKQMIDEEIAFDENYYAARLNSWRGSNLQYDDITLIGISL